MRKQIDGLVILAKDVIKQDPSSGASRSDVLREQAVEHVDSRTVAPLGVEVRKETL